MTNLRLVRRERGSMAYFKWLCETDPPLTLINGGVSPERKFVVVRTEGPTTNGDRDGEEKST
jgi:hypothetical protein